MSAVEPSTPEATMVEPDGPNDATTASEAADAVTETVRVTRRRSPRPTTSSNDRPVNSRRKKPAVVKPAAAKPAGAAPDKKEPGAVEGRGAVEGGGGVEGRGGVEKPAATELEAAADEPATAESAAEITADETVAVAPHVHAAESAGIASIDELVAVDGDEPAAVEAAAAGEPEAAASTDPAAAATEAVAVAEPAESPEEATDLGARNGAINGDAINGKAINDEATADDEPVGQGAAFPVAATIVAHGDFAREPEFSVPETAAPPSTRRNAPDTCFPLRPAPPVRPPARREPVSAPTAPSLPARRRTPPAPVPVQVWEQGDSFDDFDFFRGDAGQMPDVAASARTRPIQTARPHRHRKARPRPAFGLPALLIFVLAAAFFAWVSATPLLLTAGHGSRGTATVATCSVHGIGRSCAEFVAADGSFSAAVTLLGPASTHASAGQKLDARIVSRGSGLAYAGNGTDLLLHWIPGVVLLVLCCFGIAWAIGAFRLAGGRTRSLALLASFGGPILLFAGILAYTW